MARPRQFSDGAVLIRLAKGMSAQQIADELDVGRTAVEKRLQRLRAEHRCKTTAQLMFLFGHDAGRRAAAAP